ncbi:MAG: EcsC family protein [Gemmatimonadetes bacterium]|nr:EcsC family protein [Gemmatimonadota bacterium]
MTVYERRMSDDDLEDLKRARAFLENPSLAVRLTNLVGRPIEASLGVLPLPIRNRVHALTRIAVQKSLEMAVSTMGDRSLRPSSDGLHKILAGASGAGGGAFGILALPVELPVSTTIMLRSIADIARAEGEDITSYEGKLSCVEVFALGGPTKGDDGAETGYYAIRAALAKAVSEASSYLMQRGLVDGTAPAVVRLVSQIAARFGVVVSEKTAAQALPALGAIGGATINLIFIDHFQEMARGHFIVRRLERKYDQDTVRDEYERLT